MIVTSRFSRYFIDSATNLPAVGMTVWLVLQANDSPSYPGDYLLCTAHATRDGVYYREAVPDDEYKVYIDVAGGTTPSLLPYDEHIWIGEKRISYQQERWTFPHIEITGTKDEPQEFTTGTTPLDVDDRGDTFPVDLNDTTHKMTLELHKNQEADVFRTSSIIIGSGTMHFHLAHADVGDEYSGGGFYADIVITRHKVPTGESL
jgi:hypothetical protein